MTSLYHWLESDRQGLLLTRLESFIEIDKLNPPNGMIVYLKDGPFPPTRITFDTPSRKYELRLIAAGQMQAGIVTTAAQTFAGDKTFARAVALDNVTATPAAGPYLVLAQGAGNVVEKHEIDVTALESGVHRIMAASSSNATSGKDVKFVVTTTGIDYTIDVDGANKTVNFNLPDATGTAGSEARGLVSTGAQTFTGNKSFVRTVAVGIENCCAGMISAMLPMWR